MQKRPIVSICFRRKRKNHHNERELIRFWYSSAIMKKTCFYGRHMWKKKTMKRVSITLDSLRAVCICLT